MTHEDFNALMTTIVNALCDAPGIDADLITPADAIGTEPEIGVNVNGVDIVLIGAPL